MNDNFITKKIILTFPAFLRKKALQDSQVMALKLKPKALSPHTRQCLSFSFKYAFFCSGLLEEVGVVEVKVESGELCKTKHFNVQSIRYCIRALKVLRELTLPMLRLPSSKSQGHKDFRKPFKPCHVGVVTENSQMSTHIGLS